MASGRSANCTFNAWLRSSALRESTAGSEAFDIQHLSDARPDIPYTRLCNYFAASGRAVLSYPVRPYCLHTRHSCGTASCPGLCPCSQDISTKPQAASRRTFSFCSAVGQSDRAALCQPAKQALDSRRHRDRQVASAWLLWVVPEANMAGWH